MSSLCVNLGCLHHERIELFGSSRSDSISTHLPLADHCLSPVTSTVYESQHGGAEKPVLQLKILKASDRSSEVLSTSLATASKVVAYVRSIPSPPFDVERNHAVSLNAASRYCTLVIAFRYNDSTLSDNALPKSNRSSLRAPGNDFPLSVACKQHLIFLKNIHLEGPRITHHAYFYTHPGTNPI